MRPRERARSTTLLPLLTLLLLLTPVAAAADGAADVTVTGPLHLGGDVALADLAPDAVLALVPADGGNLDLDGTTDHLVIDVLTWREERVDNPAGAPIRHRYAPETQRHVLTDATLALTGAAPGDHASLAVAEATVVDLGLRDVTARGVAEAVLLTGVNTGGDQGEDLAGETLTLTDTVEARTRALVGDVEGNLVLRLFGPTLRATGAEGTLALTSGEELKTTTPAATTATRTLVIARWTGAAAVDARGGDLAVYGPGALHGNAFAADEARGTLVFDDEEHALDGEALGITGALAVRLVPAEGGSQDPLESVTYARAIRADVGGDFQTVTIDAARAEVVSLVMGAAGLLGLLAVVYYWPLVKFGAAALYTRLKEPELLDNEVRGAIYEVIRKSPGISARAVHRATDQSWGTVVYHLRQLERHGLVRSARVGRSRSYYERGSPYRGMEEHLTVLRNRKSRAVAELIHRSPGLTQEELIGLAGLPQSTVSYYVRKLKAADLIAEERRGKYAAYYPGEGLDGALDAVA